MRPHPSAWLSWPKAQYPPVFLRDFLVHHLSKIDQTSFLQHPKPRKEQQSETKRFFELKSWYPIPLRLTAPIEGKGIFGGSRLASLRNRYRLVLDVNGKYLAGVKFFNKTGD